MINFRIVLKYVFMLLLLALGLADAIDAAAPSSQMQTVLDALKELGGRPVETLDARTARRQPTAADAVKLVMKKQRIRQNRMANLAKVQDKQIAGAGTKIPARIYIPKGHGPFPVVVYYHGGGFVIADNNVYDASARALAQNTEAIVVAVEYRKGPEFRFPRRP